MNTILWSVAVIVLCVAVLLLAFYYRRSVQTLAVTRGQLHNAKAALQAYEQAAQGSGADGAVACPAEYRASQSSFAPFAVDGAFMADLFADETNLDTTLMATRDGLWDWDRSTDELHFNSRFLSMLGYGADAFPHNQDTWRSLLHPEDCQEAQQRQQQILDTPDFGDTFEHMFRLRAADGSYRWFLGQILHVYRDSDGRASRVVGANVDITDVKNLQEEVAAKGVDLNTILASTCDKVWEWNLGESLPQNAGGTFDASCLFTMLGQTDGMLATGFAAWASQIHPDDRDLAVALQMRIIASKQHGNSAECTYRYQSADRSFRWMLGRTTVMQRNSAGQALRVVGVHTDVTELKALRSELEVRNERLHYAFAAARDGLWDWNVETNSTYYSSRYLGMMGYDAKDFGMEQSAWEGCVHPEDREAVVARQNYYIYSAEHGDSFENTYRFRAADGSYRWILARALIVRRNAAGHGLRLVGLHTDITEMRRTQESLQILLQHDSLTGLHSRSFFESRLTTLRSGEQDPISLILCDVDGLKLVNDNLGHAEGDRLLLATAKILGAAVRSGDVVARIGGDEIAMLLPCCPEASALRVVEKISQFLREYNENSEYVPLSISIGCVTVNLHEVSAERVFRQADSAMLQDKNAKRHQVRECLRSWLHEHTGQLIDTVNDCRLGNV